MRLCIGTGVAGLSIEDNSGRKDRPLYDVNLAAERIRAARAAVGDSGALLVARAECFLVGLTNIDEVIRRLTAYANAGADCLYAPGIRDRKDIAAVVAAVAPKNSSAVVSDPSVTRLLIHTWSVVSPHRVNTLTL